MERNKLRQREGVEVKRLWRAALFASTGLSAVLAMPAPARAQIDPSTTPQGGTVVGGSATITQAPGTTTIDQSSQRTAIDWQSFNVGANAEVQFNQPNASSVALNRVTGGDLSQIYGRIDANGQIILINQSGVVFAKGSQVNAESIVVSTANISDQDFMAGHMNFTGGSNPGAKIINDGKITAGQAGLVGLVAPQVSNSGVITARLGQVVLAGATAFTLDLYGDRLISLDVTQAVRSIDLGGKAVPALVTNSGVILADGGKITLTAQDADALVTQLINAGGTLRADTVGGQTGAISLQGVGGNIQIAGNLLARGTASGTAGGVIEASTTGTVAVASTAMVDASGATGGGVIAIGTDLARAAQGAADVTAPKAQTVTIASGAALKADATTNGNAGKIVLLSAKETDFQGAVSVQGGAQGGNGGIAEISSDGVISLGGSVIATAIDGQPGEILLDPQTLVVLSGGLAFGAGSGGTVTFGGTDNSVIPSLVDPGQLNSLSGTVILEASKLVSVASAINMTNASALSISSGGNVSISANITVNGSLDIDASNSLVIGAKLAADNSILLKSGAAGTNIDGLVTVTGAGVITLASTGTISEDATNGTLEADTLLSAGSIGGDLLLTNTGNDIFNVGPLSAANISIYSAAILNAIGSVSAGNIDLTASALNFDAPVKATGLLTLDVTGDGLAHPGTIGQNAAGNISAATLSLTAGGDAVLSDTNNAVGIVSGSAAGSISLGDNENLSLGGGLTGSSVLLDLAAGKSLSLGSGNTINATGTGGVLSIIADTLNLSSPTAGAIQAKQGTIIVAPATSTRAITVTDGIGLNGLVLGPNFFTDVQNQEQVLQLGNSGFSGDITLGQQSLIPFTPDTANFGTAALDLISQGGATQNGVLTAGTLSFNTGTFAQGLLSTITVNELDGTASNGDVNVSDAANQIGSFGSVGASGNIIINDNQAASLTGAISTTGTITLQNGGGGYTETTGGAIDAGTLTTGLGSISGAAVFGNANSISNIGNFAASALTLDDATGLTAAGTVSAGSITLTGTSLNEAATGAALNTGTLSTGAGSFSGNVSLTGTGNSIASLGAFTLGNGGNLALKDAEALTLTNVISTSGAVTLNSTGAITEASGGVIDAGTFSGGSSGGDVRLFNNNAISTLDGISVVSGHNFVLIDPVSLSVGNVTASTVGISAGNMNLNGTIAAATGLALASSGSIVQGSTGVIEAGTLSTGGASVTGSAFLTGANSIATLGSFIAGGDFSLNDKINLTIADALSAPNINLAAPTLTADAPVTAGTAGGMLGLVFDAVIIGGSGSFAAPTGTIAIAPFTAGHGIDLAGTAANDLDLSAAFLNSLDPTATEILLGKAEGYTAANITIDSTASIAAPHLVLSTPGGITDNGVLQVGTLGFDAAGFSQIGTGALDVTLLEGDGAPITGNVALTGTLNNIGTIGSLAAGTYDLSVTDSAFLNVAGPVTAQDITLIDSDTNIFAGGMEITGTVSAASNGTLSLVANSLFGDTGTLAGGTVAIAPYTAEQINLGGTGLFALDLSQALLNLVSPSAVLQIGTAAGHSGGAIVQQSIVSLASTELLLSGAGITFDGTLSLPGLLALDSTGAITQASTGAIEAATLTSGGTTIGGGASLTGANSIGSIGTFAASGAIALNDIASLAINGLISTPGELSLGDTGGINESGGAINAGTLDSGGTSIGGDAAFTGTNSITTLGGLTVASGHSFSLDDATALTVAGPVVAPTAVISATGISLTGNISAATLLELESTGGITQSSGTITTGTLTSGGTSIGGDAVLTDANAISNLGGFTVASGHTLSVTDAGLLTVAGPVSASSAVLSAGSIAVAGDINAATLLALKSTGSITQTSGTITTGSLTSGGSTIGGGVSLAGANSITSIGSFAASGNILISDAAALAINGLISTPGALSLEDTSGITETGGIKAGTLNSGGTSIGGDVALTGSNSIATLAGFTVASGHGLTLDNAALLTVAGPVSASTITLSATSLALTGNIDAATGLALVSSGGITQAGGTITTGSLTSGGTTIGSTVSLSGANAITSLGDFAAGGPITVIDNASLAITGQIRTPGALSLEDSAGITETSGGIIAGSLDSGGTTVGGDVALTGTNSIATLAGFTVASGHDFSFDNATALTISGPVSAATATISASSLALTGNISAPIALALKSTGGITQSGGSITTGNLTSGGTTIAGDVSLTDANAITALGNFAATGNVTLHNTQLLNIAGTLASGGTVALEADAGVTETTGMIDAADLTSFGNGITGDAVLNGANSIASLGNFTAANLSLSDQSALGITGAVSIGGTLALLDTGNITQIGGSIIAAALTSNGGTIGGAVSLTQSGNQLPDIGDFAASGGLALTDADAIDLTGDIFTGTNALNLITADNITQNGGIITAGALNASAANISLGGANAITALGSVSTGELYVNGVAGLTGPVNATDATLTSTGGFTLAGPAAIANTLLINTGAGGSLIQTANSGPVTAANATFTSGADITLSGTTSITDQLDLIAAGNIIHNAGSLSAGTLVGSANALAQFAAYTDFATLGSFIMNDSTFALDNAGALTFIGPLVANVVSITVHGLLTLEGYQNGGLFITGKIEPTTVTTPQPGDSVITVAQNPNVDNGNPRVVQTGTFYINAGPNAQRYLGNQNRDDTLFITTMPSGNITFDMAPGGLDAPTTDLALGAGPRGIITGNVNLYRIVILNALSTDLTGVLDNIPGQAGAGKGVANPFPTPNFRFNACPIGSVNCTILPIESLPSTNPLQNFDIDQRKKKRLNHNVQLPGIATRDF